jgi:hypothetical protein
MSNGGGVVVAVTFPGNKKTSDPFFSSGTHCHREFSAAKKERQRKKEVFFLIA